jgi:hypothetical protein
MKRYSMKWMAHSWRSWRRWARLSKRTPSPLVLPPWDAQCQRLQDQMAILEARMETLETAHPSSSNFPAQNDAFEVPDAHLGAL